MCFTDAGLRTLLSLMVSSVCDAVFGSFFQATNCILFLKLFPSIKKCNRKALHHANLHKYTYDFIFLWDGFLCEDEEKVPINVCPKIHRADTT